MRKRLARSGVLRFFTALACMSLSCWFALFLYVNVYNAPTRLATFSLLPLFEGFASRSAANRAARLASLKREIILLKPAVSDLSKLVKERQELNGTHSIAHNCSVYHNARFIDYPVCEEKFLWMSEMWTSDPCYAAFGVRGDACSVLDYLSSVERLCPRPQSRQYSAGAVRSSAAPAPFSSAFRLRDFDTALKYLKPPRSGRPTLVWITERIRTNWYFWQHAATSICSDLRSQKKQKHSDLDTEPSRALCGSLRLRVHVHIGSLTRVSGTRIAELAGHGGPLGELVQWSDLLAGLIVLGHNLTITTELEEFVEFIRSLPRWNSPCQDAGFGIDLLYTDIGGLVQLRQHVLTGWLDKWKCVLRVVDTFGTEPKFNDFNYATRHSLATTWGRWNMHSRQFYTMFPHTPDNSFMGFVIASNETSDVSEIVRIELELDRAYRSSNATHSNSSGSYRVRDPRGHQHQYAAPDAVDASTSPDVTEPSINDHDSSKVVNASSRPVTPSKFIGEVARLPRRDSIMGLVYGKTLDIWQGREDFLRVFNDYMVLHATVSGDDSRGIVPSYVVNHGLISSEELERLYRTASVFIGLGFPYEGPSPLEAIAHGCVFINPRFAVPINRDNSEFFSGKPTTRKLSSQHPYMETYVGPPYVYSVDAGNETELRQVIELILTRERPKAYVPYEFTPVGFLERLIFYQSKPSLCPLRSDYTKTSLLNAIETVNWPPASCVQTYLGVASLSCNEVCELHRQVCEPNYFLLSNHVEVLENYGIDCVNVTRDGQLGYPAVRIVNSVSLSTEFRRSANLSATTFSSLSTLRQNSSSLGKSRHRLVARCFLQDNDRLFSCADVVPDMRRVCPCRRYRSVRKQTVMC